MSINLIRVVNQQVTQRSILIDKLDDGQANTEGYANLRKQQVYVPYSNPIDPSVKGYVDLVPSDRVLLSADRGTIHGLASSWNVHGFVNSGVVYTFAFDSSLISTPTITSVSYASPNTTINGTTFLSLMPDITYAILTNSSGVSQKIPFPVFTVFTANQIVIPNSAITIGTPAEGWTIKVQANSKVSNTASLFANPVLTSATIDLPGVGDLTLVGSSFLSASPTVSSVLITGTGAITLTQTAILAAGGVAAFTDTSIVIPAALIPGVVAATSSAQVQADGLLSAVVAVV